MRFERERHCGSGNLIDFYMKRHEGISQDTVDRVCQAILDTPIPDDIEDLSDMLWTPARGGAVKVLGLWIGPCESCGHDGLTPVERAALISVEAHTT